MSCTVIPFCLLKSARQHGVVLLVGALHWPCIGTYRVLAPVHAAALATIAHVTPRQHEPVETGHRFGRHVVPEPRNVAGLTHAVRVVLVHAPLATQHAPVGWAHTTPVHVVAPAVNVPGHCGASVMAQLPSAKQHAPFWFGGHGLGVHGTPTCHVETPVHALSSTDVHAPVASLQHAPFCGTTHGLGVHDGLAPHTFGTAHEANAPTVHVAPLGVQHVPITGCGHGFGVHDVAPPTPPLVHTPPVPQAETTPYVQAPVWAMQHVPIGGWGQGFVGAQVCAIVQVLPVPVHCTWKFCTHAPVTALQHVPEGGAGQMLGVQLPLSVQVLLTEQLA